MNRPFLLKAKLTVLSLLGLYVAAFIAVNSLTTAKVWLFPFITRDLSVAIVIGVTMLVTFLLTWFGRQLIGTIRELRGSAKPVDAADKEPQDQGRS